MKEIQTDQCRLVMFTEWLIIATCRLKLDSFIRGLLPGSSFLEQQGATLGFQIPKRTLAMLKEQGARNSTTVLARLEGGFDNEATSSTKKGADTGKANAPLGVLFGVLEKIKASYGIQEYAITPTALEQIFNNFVTGRDDLTGEADFQVDPIPTGHPTGQVGDGTGYTVSPAYKHEDSPKHEDNDDSPEHENSAQVVPGVEDNQQDAEGEEKIISNTE